MISKSYNDIYFKVLVNREITTDDQLHPRIFIEKVSGFVYL